jgi:thymidylate synthase
MNKLDKQYTDLLQDILDNGVEKKDRTGTGTISVFGRQIRHDMKDGFPLLTTKKMPFKTITTELLWFLQGRTDLRYLLENNCHIWTGDAYKVYDKDFDREHPPFSAPYPTRLTEKEFEEKIMSDDDFNKWYGDLGPIYGKQWRKWRTGKLKSTSGETWDKCEPIFINQIQNLINDLRTNPDSRRLMVNAWNVGELDQMVLPPCHYGFQVYTRELSDDEIYTNYPELLQVKRDKLAAIKSQNYEIAADLRNIEKTLEENLGDLPTRAISLMWNQRSVDTFLGLPFNIASYGLLLEIIAKEVNMVPDQLIGNLGDVHLYSNHVEQAKEQIGRELSLEERLVLADIFNPLIREDCLTKTHHEDEIEELKLQYRNEWLDSLGVIPKRTRESFPLPTLKLGHFGSILENVFVVDLSDFILENYQSHPTIKAPLSN